MASQPLVHRWRCMGVRGMHSSNTETRLDLTDELDMCELPETLLVCAAVCSDTRQTRFDFRYSRKPAHHQYQKTILMSTTSDLVTAIKKELKATQMTYADLAQALGMAESSVKRMLAKGDMSLSRVDEICRAIKIDFAELSRRVADAQPLLSEMTQEQERAVVADKKLLLAAICVLSQWTLEQITTRYRMSEAECVKYFAQLDRIAIASSWPKPSAGANMVR